MVTISGMDLSSISCLHLTNTPEYCISRCTFQENAKNLYNIHQKVRSWNKAGTIDVGRLDRLDSLLDRGTTAPPVLSICGAYHLTILIQAIHQHDPKSTFHQFVCKKIKKHYGTALLGAQCHTPTFSLMYFFDNTTIDGAFIVVSSSNLASRILQISLHFTICYTPFDIRIFDTILHYPRVFR